MTGPERVATELIETLHQAGELTAAQMIPLAEIIKRDSLASLMIRCIAGLLNDWEYHK